MANYSYRAINTNGTAVEGTISVPNAASAREMLKARGYAPVKITEGVPATRKRAKKLALPEVIHFCRQLSIILNAGVSLVNGLNILRRQKLTKTMQTEVGRLFAETQAGRSLSEVMEEAEGLYPKLLVGMFAIGEISGNLEKVAASMADYYEREARVKQKLQSLMIYPAFLVLAACGLLIFFINFLLPELLKMLQESGAPLPAITRSVIFCAGFLQSYFLHLLLFLAFVAFLWITCVKKTKVKFFLERLAINIPVIGSILRMVIQARFCRTLSILLRSGVPLLQAMESVKQVIGNSIAGEAVQRAVDGLQRGEQVAGNLAAARFFDELFIYFFQTGEETGELENILGLMTENYEQQSEAAFSRLSALVEPAMTVIMGLIVGIIVLSVVLPMYSLLDTLKR